jgi:EAL and modified HD-GYP domain-containing signal transduction protein
VKLLAEKVETREQFRHCLDLGFDYFQGYFLCRPDVVTGRRVSPSRVAAMQLLARFQDPKVDLRELSEIIGHDLSLTHRLLRVINSAGPFLQQKVESISQAVLLLGVQFVAKLASLVLLARMEDQPQELTTTAIVRARMCELLGTRAGQEPPDTFFLVGLFSTLDAILAMSLEAALSQLPLAEKVRAALLAREGILGEVLDCVVAFERGDWDAVLQARLDRSAIQQSYLDAIAWAAKVA